ncbi:hypothetical protein ACSQ67_021377 [Phaseolus vulgaris]
MLTSRSNWNSMLENTSVCDSFKVVLIGDSEIGKSNLLLQKMYSVFYLILEPGIFKVEADDHDDEFVKVRGVQLVLNERPYYANGYNAYSLMYMASDPSQRNKVSSVF